MRTYIYKDNGLTVFECEARDIIAADDQYALKFGREPKTISTLTVTSPNWSTSANI